MSFAVEIASVPDRDSLVAEIWYNDDMVAELYTLSGGIELALYGAPHGRAWTFDSLEFLSAPELARARLAEPY